MNQEQVLGIIRHILTIAAGSLIANGVVDESTATTIVGGAVAIIGVAWSFISKRKAA